MANSVNYSGKEGFEAFLSQNYRVTHFKGHRVIRDELYEKYKQFCTENNHIVANLVNVGMTLANQGVKAKARVGGYNGEGQRYAYVGLWEKVEGEEPPVMNEEETGPIRTRRKRYTRHKTIIRKGRAARLAQREQCQLGTKVIAFFKHGYKKTDNPEDRVLKEDYLNRLIKFCYSIYGCDMYAHTRQDFDAELDNFMAKMGVQSQGGYYCGLKKHSETPTRYVDPYTGTCPHSVLSISDQLHSTSPSSAQPHPTSSSSTQPHPTSAFPCPFEPHPASPHAYLFTPHPSQIESLSTSFSYFSSPSSSLFESDSSSFSDFLDYHSASPPFSPYPTSPSSDSFSSQPASLSSHPHPTPPYSDSFYDFYASPELSPYPTSPSLSSHLTSPSSSQPHPSLPSQALPQPHSATSTPDIPHPNSPDLDSFELEPSISSFSNINSSAAPAVPRPSCSCSELASHESGLQDHHAEMD